MTTVCVGLHDEGAATDPCVGWLGRSILRH